MTLYPNFDALLAACERKRLWVGLAMTESGGLRIVVRRPKATAAVLTRVVVGYEQLDERAKDVARDLKRRGVLA